VRNLNRVAVVLLVLCLAALADSAYAYLPLYEHPSEIARQAELIVVGHLEQGSVEYLTEKVKRWDKELTWYAPRAKLLVTEVVRGKLAEKELPVWFRGTAVPVVGGRFEWDFGNGRRKFGITRKGVDKDVIQIYEVNNSYYQMNQGRDLRTDHLWFLKLHGGLPGKKPDEREWGLDSPQYIVPTEEKEKYLPTAAKSGSKPRADHAAPEK
jgi:hypothetical protein